MNNMDQLTEQYKEKFPHLRSYTECVSRTFISGLAATFLTFSGTFMAVSLLKNKLPSTRPGHLNVVAAGLFGTIVGFQVVYTRIKACNNGWLAAENRATYLQPLAVTRAEAAESSNTPAD